MNKTDQLFIRACKSLNPETRLRSVYKRFYFETDDEKRIRVSLVVILGRIVDENLSVSVIEVLTGLNPADPFVNRDKPEYLDRALSFLTSKIRLSRADEFEGLLSPAKFRNQSVNSE